MSEEAWIAQRRADIHWTNSRKTCGKDFHMSCAISITAHLIICFRNLALLNGVGEIHANLLEAGSWSSTPQDTKLGVVWHVGQKIF